jgi:DNA-binding IscR family transcriptional regulator
VRQGRDPLEIGGMISQKAKYAFKALLYLAERTPETTVQIEEIARGEGVPR